MMTLDAENWEQLQQLFHLALAAPVAERERVLREACADPELRRLTMELLGEEEAGEAAKGAAQPDGQPVILSGRIGAYTLVRLLGSGGIGTVYLVERTVGNAVLRFAMKVLAPHAAGPEFVERFHREEKILASLEHAHITRMVDAGITETGQPYLVMEYVEGEHLDAYCDRRKLGIRQRLWLFLRVCDAVAYAHRNLIVHLDLKPSNILVTAEGHVKLLDFGTSKLLQPDALSTSTVMATPAYASPEQLRNEPLTTACDVYSLGVILFELLSGRRPGGKASVAAMLERAINEREPERLTHAVDGEAAEKRGLTEGRLLQTLRGDLSSIVAKCLHPRAKDRYQTLDALAEDIRRYIEGRPVLVRSQTTLYLVGKFVRRKWKLVIAATVALLMLVGALGYAEWRQEQAVLEGQRALRMQTFLYRLLYLANSNYMGKPNFTVPDFLELGVKLLPAYIKDPADLRKAQMSLAESMYENSDLKNAERVFMQVIASAKASGDIDTESEAEGTCGDVAYLLGQSELGLQLTTHALELSKRPGVSAVNKVWAKVFYATNRDRLGFRTDETLRLLQEAAKEAHQRNVLPERELGDVMYSYGWDLKLRDRYAEAEPVFREALGIYQRDPQAVCDQSATWGELAYLRDQSGDVRGSVPMYEQAYEGEVTCSGGGSRGALEQQERLAGALIKLGQAQRAVPMLEQSLPAWRKIAGGSPDMGDPLSYLARGYLAMGRYAEAERAAEEIASAEEGKVSPTDRRIGAAQLFLAQSLEGERRYAEALPHARRAVGLLVHGVSAEAKQMDADAAKTLLAIETKVS
jgi:serine/threonine-protein kinase